MFVIGVYEPRGATPEPADRTVDRQFDRSFSNQPHFGVHMVVYGCGAPPGGSVVNFVASGTCTLNVHATGGTNHAATTGSPQSFTIKLA